MSKKNIISILQYEMRCSEFVARIRKQNYADLNTIKLHRTKAFAQYLYVALCLPVKTPYIQTINRSNLVTDFLERQKDFWYNFTKIFQTLQAKMLRMISSASWHVSNQTLHSDFNIPYVTEVVRINANKYKTRSTEHSNQLIRALFSPSVDR